MKPCHGGEHSLEVIYDDTHSLEVVRWCAFCGAVVVDQDYDGRTNPGAVMQMKFPEVMRRMVKHPEVASVLLQEE